MKYKTIDLQLFADGGAGAAGGDGGAAAGAGDAAGVTAPDAGVPRAKKRKENPLAAVKYGKQTEAIAPSPDATGAAEAANRGAALESSIRSSVVSGNAGNLEALRASNLGDAGKNHFFPPTEYKSGSDPADLKYSSAARYLCLTPIERKNHLRRKGRLQNRSAVV